MMHDAQRPGILRLAGNRSVARHVALRVTSALTAATMALFVCGPQSAPFVVVGCAVLALTWSVLDNTGFNWRVSPWTLLALGALIAWFVMAGLWSADPGKARMAVFMYAFSAGLVLAAFGAIDNLSDDVRHRISIAFCLTMMFIFWLVLFEHSTGMFVRRMLNTYLPLTRPVSIHLRMEGGRIVEMLPYVSNKSVAAATVMLWPALLISRGHLRLPWLPLLRYATVAALVAGVFLAGHEASKLALIVGALVFAVTRASRTAGFGLIAAGWFGATLLVFPLALEAYKRGAHMIEAVQFSGRHRLVIWGVTAERTLLKPVSGYGFASTRVLDEMSAAAERRMVPGTNIPEGTNMHSHNVFIQTWYETGATGAVLMFLAGLPILAWLRRRSDDSAPYMFAGFTVAVILASLSWSLVATWYIAMFGVIAVWMRFADGCAGAGATRP